MLQEMIFSDNPLVKYTTRAVVVFGPLYLLSAYGYKWANFLAGIIFLGMLIFEVGYNRRSFSGTSTSSGEYRKGYV